MPASDHFCDCVTLGILETFVREYINARAPQEVAVCCWSIVGLSVGVVCGMLNSLVERNKMKLDILTAQIRLAPKNSTLQPTEIV